MPAQFTPCPGGFVTAVPLPGGRILVEGWTLTSDGDGGAQHENAFRWTAPDEQDAAATVAEFAASLAAPRPARPAGPWLLTDLPAA